ncbi:replication initiation protein [Rufibacter hautae]|uniref:Replication initiation protein n=1 Tax=Rufibacter hautae TaxID=2595005 RepID=A0A5B6T797_9BACT|nr:replication initiation protein [Rufibacter hautae]KAA3435915.1 replication initiation protein [Rufibacter hautae]
MKLVSQPPHKQAAQHNLLVRVPFRMSIMESRIFTLLLSYIHKDDKDFKEINIPLERILGDNLSGRSYKLVREACKSLFERSVNILPVDAHKNDLDEIHFFDRIKLTTGKGMVTAWFSNQIKPYLLDLKGEFTISEIEKLLSLRNAHAHRMYWFLKSIRKMRSKTIDVEELRFMLLADKSKYPKYGEFNKHVLKPALDEIVELEDDDLKFSLIELKEGKQVIKLKFKFNDLPEEPEQSTKHIQADLFNQPSQKIEYTGTELKAWNLMMKYKLDEKQGRFFLTFLKGEEITKVIYTEYSLKKSIVKNPAAHIYEALQKLVEMKKNKSL